MPTYEYECLNCEKRFEVHQSINARPLKKHDECGGPVKKIFHPAGLIFRGSGFYKTDSRAKPKSNPSDSAAGGDST